MGHPGEELAGSGLGAGLGGGMLLDEGGCNGVSRICERCEVQHDGLSLRPTSQAVRLPGTGCQRTATHDSLGHTAVRR